MNLSPTHPYQGSFLAVCLDLWWETWETSYGRSGCPNIHFMVCPQASPADTRFTIMSQLRLDWPSKGSLGFSFFLLFFFLTVFLLSVHSGSRVQIDSTWCWKKYLSNPEIMLRHWCDPSQLIFLKTQMFTRNFPSNPYGRNNNLSVSLTHINLQFHSTILKSHIK